jgi:hypothetical protein
MSEENNFHYLATGVFKIDSMYAGFPDLEKIAQEWAKDECFYELIVRKVSESNYGIQFLYFTTDLENDNAISKRYKAELMEKFDGKKGVYAWDFHESSSTTEEGLNKTKRIIIKSKELNF